MSFDWFNNAIKHGMATDYDTFWRNTTQDFQDDVWENTSQEKNRNIMEQKLIGEFEKETDWQHVLAWVAPATQFSGVNYYKTLDQSLQFLYKDIQHEITIGKYLKYDDNFWIIYSTGHNIHTQNYCLACLCDQNLKIFDGNKNKVYNFPCHLNNEATAGQETLTNYVITPNNKIIVVVQKNKDTDRLIKLNSRFIIAGRPFKLIAFQNAHNEYVEKEPTIIYASLQLDELDPRDDLLKGLAYNGDTLPNADIQSRQSSAEIRITPQFDKVRVGQSISFTVGETALGSCSTTATDVTLTQDGNTYTLTGVTAQSVPIILTLEDGDKICNKEIYVRRW